MEGKWKLGKKERLREVILAMKFMSKEIHNLYIKFGVQISYKKFKIWVSETAQGHSQKII